MRRLWSGGCVCGCGTADECVTQRPTPASSHCACATLGIDVLRRTSTVRWHLSGHPADWIGVAA